MSRLFYRPLLLGLLLAPTGCSVEVSTTDDSALDQNVLRIDVQPDHPYEIVAQHSGKCLDVDGAGQNNGANVWQWDCLGVTNQKWTLRDVGGDYYQIVAQHSGKCLDVDGASQNNGANVWQWDCVGVANQKWAQRPVGAAYEIVAAHSGKCLDVDGAGQNNGTNVWQWECVGAANQRWTLR